MSDHWAFAATITATAESTVDQATGQSLDAHVGAHPLRYAGCSSLRAPTPPSVVGAVCLSQEQKRKKLPLRSTCINVRAPLRTFRLWDRNKRRKYSAIEELLLPQK